MSQKQPGKIKIPFLGMAWSLVLLSFGGFFWWAWGGGSLSPQSLQRQGAVLLPVPQSKPASEKGTSLSSIPLPVDKSGPSPEEKPSALETAPLLDKKGAPSETVSPPISSDMPKEVTPSQKPLLQHARPFNEMDSRPRVSLILTGLGPYRELTRRAIYELPPEVTLAFAPYTRDLGKIMKEARDFGHEVMIMLPLEPENRSQRDPGPYTLVTTDSLEKNKERLDQILSKGVEMVGVIGFMGARFVKFPEHLEPILQTLWNKGYLYVGGNLSLEDQTSVIASRLKGDFTAVDRSLDMEISGVPLETQLKDLEALANLKNKVVATGYLYPATLEKIKPWISSLKKKGLALASATACRS